MSFVKSKKRIGPKTDLRGTPLCTGETEHTTRLEREVRQIFFQFSERAAGKHCSAEV